MAKNKKVAKNRIEPLTPEEIRAIYDQLKRESLADFDEAKLTRQFKRMKFVPFKAVIAKLEGKRTKLPKAKTYAQIMKECARSKKRPPL